MRNSWLKRLVADQTAPSKKESKHVDHSAEEYRILDAVRERVAEILAERGLELY